MKRAALLVAASAFVYFGLHARAADDPTESGIFALFKFEQEIGEERYDIRSSAGSFALTSTFSFNDRGTPVPLDTTLQFDRAANRLRPACSRSRDTPLPPCR